MRQNLELTHGALFSQRVLLALVEHGTSREDAYRIVRELAQRAWDERTPLRDLLAADQRLRERQLDLDSLFDYEPYLRYAEEIVARLDTLPAAAPAVA
jgi:adenylosuccinate lyase